MWRSLEFYDSDETQSLPSQSKSQGSYKSYRDVKDVRVDILDNLKYKDKSGDVQTMSGYDNSMTFRSSPARIRYVNGWYIVLTIGTQIRAGQVRVPATGGNDNPYEDFCEYLLISTISQRFNYSYTQSSLLSWVASQVIAYVRLGKVSISPEVDQYIKETSSLADLISGLTEEGSSYHLPEISQISYIASHMFYMLSSLVCQWDENYKDATGEYAGIPAQLGFK